MEIPIGNGFYQSSSLPVSNQQCKNFFVNIPEVSTLSERQLFGTPGLFSLISSGTKNQENRGSGLLNEVPFFVNGDSLYRLSRSIIGTEEFFTLDTIGTVEGTGRVSICSNSTQICVLVPGGRAYIYDESTFQEITDVDFYANGNPLQIIFVDGYFIATTDEKKWIVSSLNNGLSWNALDFGSAESDPDRIVACVAVHNQVYLLGSLTTEGFQNVGGSGFPFQRNNVFLDKGCLAPFSVVKSDQFFYMIGSGTNQAPAIWKFTGTSFAKVSTSAIDTLLGTYSTRELENAFGFSYSGLGAYFICFSFSNKTIAYNEVTGLWNEHTSNLDDLESRWRVNSVVNAYARLLVGDKFDGRIGVLDFETFGEYENDIIREFSLQPFVNNGNTLRMGAIELTTESGVGNSNVEDPVISMALSSDGKLFKAERIRKLGRKGEYSRRQIWHKNGSMDRMAVLRFRLTDQVKPVIIKLEVA